MLAWALAALVTIGRNPAMAAQARGKLDDRPLQSRGESMRPSIVPPAARLRTTNGYWPERLSSR